jgi:hypothetical protein
MFTESLPSNALAIHITILFIYSISWEHFEILVLELNHPFTTILCNSQDAMKRTTHNQMDKDNNFNKNKTGNEEQEGAGMTHQAQHMCTSEGPQMQ